MAPVVLDKRALRCLLDLAVRGAAADGAKLAPKTAETWQALAGFATEPGSATISLTGAGSFPVPGAGEWMTVTEAAQLLGCSRGHTRRLARLGAIRARRHGERVWLIERDAVMDRKKAA